MVDVRRYIKGGVVTMAGGRHHHGVAINKLQRPKIMLVSVIRVLYPSALTRVSTRVFRSGMGIYPLPVTYPSWT